MIGTDAYDRWMEGFSTERLDLGFGEETLDRVDLQDPIGVPPETSLAACMDLMKRARVGCLLVGRDKVVEGIFTERDVLTRVAGSNVDLDEATVADFMTPNPDCLQEGDRLVQALSLMIDGGFRHVPVVRQGRAIGVFGMRHCMQIIVDLFPEAILNAPPQGQSYGVIREGA